MSSRGSPACSSTAPRSTAATTSSALAPFMRGEDLLERALAEVRVGEAELGDPVGEEQEQVAGLEREVALAELGRAQAADDRAAQGEALDAA